MILRSKENPSFIHSCKSLIGKKNEKTNNPCQDYCRVITFSTGGFFSQSTKMMVAIVSDGAGSADLSHVGSRQCVESGIKLIKRHAKQFINSHEENFHVKIVDNIREEIKHLSQSNNKKIKDYASTFLAAIIIKNGDGFRWHTWHIGDGIIVGDFFDGNGPVIVSMPENGEFKNETYFITDDNFELHLRIKSGQANNCRFAMMTDGVSDSLCDHKKNYLSPSLIRIMDSFHKKSTINFDNTLVDNMKIIMDDTDDDLTLALLMADG